MERLLLGAREEEAGKYPSGNKGNWAAIAPTHLSSTHLTKLSFPSLQALKVRPDSCKLWKQLSVGMLPWLQIGDLGAPRCFLEAGWRSSSDAALQGHHGQPEPVSGWLGSGAATTNIRNHSNG